MKERKVNILIGRIFSLALECIISLIITLAVFTLYRHAGLHDWWSQFVERLL
ncbi:MAG: hypothetical protein JSU90_01325 [Nitrospiraceae bacterium]|nr:MAG: hypothetical protein JSU90_01325 [Nitrospiraceae bacterium]